MFSVIKGNIESPNRTLTNTCLFNALKICFTSTVNYSRDNNKLQSKSTNISLSIPLQITNHH